MSAESDGSGSERVEGWWDDDDPAATVDEPSSWSQGWATPGLFLRLLNREKTRDKVLGFLDSGGIVRERRAIKVTMGEGINFES